MCACVCVYSQSHVFIPAYRQCASVYLRLEPLSIRKTPLQLCRGRRIAAKTEKIIIMLDYIKQGAEGQGSRVELP